MVNDKPKSLIVCGPYPYEFVYSNEAKESIASLTELLEDGRQEGDLLHNRPDLLEQVEVLFTGWFSVKVTDEFLRAAPNLKAIFHAGGSVKWMIKTDAFWNSGITISNAISVNAIPVAEFCLAQIILSLKRYWYCISETQHEGYFPTRWDLYFAGGYGSKVGLISFGSIARKLVELLKPFDLEILVHSLPRDEAAIIEAGATPVSLETVFREADVVSLHVPLIESTRRMIRGSHFRLMKENAAFINTARGGLIDNDELVEVALARPDLTFLLDVVDPEPPPPGDIMYSTRNIVLSPHLAGSLNRECERMGNLMVDELNRYLKGEPLRYSLSREDVRIMA